MSSRPSTPATPEYRRTEDLPYRVRRPLGEVPFHAEPTVAPPRPWKSSKHPRVGEAAKSKKSRQSSDPLEMLGVRTERTREQIDTLEKILLNGMPPRVLLENSLAGLRHAIATEFDTLAEVQWKRGVKHGESIRQSEITALNDQLRMMNFNYSVQTSGVQQIADTDQSYLSHLPESYVPIEVTAEPEFTAADLERYLSQSISPLHTQPPTPRFSDDEMMISVQTPKLQDDDVDLLASLLADDQRDPITEFALVEHDFAYLNTMIA